MSNLVQVGQIDMDAPFGPGWDGMTYRRLYPNGGVFRTAAIQNGDDGAATTPIPIGTPQLPEAVRALLVRPGIEITLRPDGSVWIDDQTANLTDLGLA